MPPLPTPLRDSMPTLPPSGLVDLKDSYDLVIVGAGLAGGVIAERAATLLGKRSLIIDKRDHIGGNVYDFIDEHGFRVSKYGVHLFHTKSERVWEYVNKFSEWMPYEHKVKCRVEGKIVGIPPNQDTVNLLFNANVHNEAEMAEWLEKRQVKSDHPANGEEAALSKAGPELYEAIFKHYTKKQWDKYPAQLDASVLLRIPVRTNKDDRYFTDAFQVRFRQGVPWVQGSGTARMPLAPTPVGFRVYSHLTAHGHGPLPPSQASQATAVHGCTRIFENNLVNPRPEHPTPPPSHALPSHGYTLTSFRTCP